MELCSYLETDSRSSAQEILGRLMNPDVHYCVHKSTPSVLLKATTSHPISWRSILSISYLLKCLKCLSRIRATGPANLIPLVLITVMTFGKKDKLRSFQLCNFFQPPATSSLLDLNIHLSTLFSNTLDLRYVLSLLRQKKCDPSV
jgi:hypothetical protein